MDMFCAAHYGSLMYYWVLPATLLLTLYLYSCYKLNYWRRKGVYQLSNTNVFFGDFKNAILFRTSPGNHLGEIYHQSPSDSPFVGFYIFHKPCLLLKDPEIVKHLLIRDFHNFSNRHFGGLQQRDGLGMTSLFAVRNPAWRYLRQKITPRFTRHKLKQMVPLMMNTSKPMMSYISNNVDRDEEPKCMDAQDLNRKYTADLFANLVLGVNTDSFTYPDSEYMKFWDDFFSSLRRMISFITVFFVPNFARICIGSSIYFDTSIVSKIFWKSIEIRERSATKRGDIIDEFIEMKNGKQDPVFQFSGDNMYFQTGTFFGLESSTTAVAFTLLGLAQNTKFQERARQDIKQAIDLHGWTIDAFNEMKYLDQCINEAIRLHPPVPIVDRETLEDYNIPKTNICIEKGTAVYVSLYGLHRDPRYFDEPDVFNPERFDDNRNVSDAYIPFGVGPRRCVGTAIGVLHVKVVISVILSEYELYQQQEAVNKLDPRFTFTAASNGINLEFTKLTL